jgi:mono/diheme cytochrome c family protein
MTSQCILPSARWLAACAVLCAPAVLAQTAALPFPPEHVVKGAQLYADNCEPCHGSHMRHPGGEVFDLRTFPPEQRSRFFESVSNGKRNMPPWRSALSQEEIGFLFAYVIAGEPK